MSVFHLSIGQSAKIVSVRADGATAERLAALGLSVGKTVTVLSFSLFRSSVLLGVGQTRVALRRAAAEAIGVAV